MLRRNFVLPPINSLNDKLPLEMQNQTFFVPFALNTIQLSNPEPNTIGALPLPQIAYSSQTIPMGQKSIQHKQEVTQQQKSSLAPKKCKLTPDEDQKLINLVMKYGSRDWLYISQKMMTRNPRQCRERWNNYLNPNLTSEPWTTEEDRLLIAKFQEYGCHWSKISKFFSKRSHNSVRNRWQLLLRQSEKRISSSSSTQISDA